MHEPLTAPQSAPTERVAQLVEPTPHGSGAAEQLEAQQSGPASMGGAATSTSPASEKPTPVPSEPASGDEPVASGGASDDPSDGGSVARPESCASVRPGDEVSTVGVAVSIAESVSGSASGRAIETASGGSAAGDVNALPPHAARARGMAKSHGRIIAAPAGARGS